MKTKIFTLFLALIASVGIVLASNTQVDGIWYNFDTHYLTASVTYRGSSVSEYDDEYTGTIVIPSTVTYNLKTYSVTSIGEDAFFNCSGLTSVVIPNSVTSIGGYAFEYCTGLTSVTIGNSVTSIGVNAFYGCTGLTSVEIPNSVTSIGEDAFYGCTGLTSVEIPNSVTSIGEDAFYGCTGLTSIVIGNGVTSIGEKAFYNCSGLTSLTIGDNVTSISKNAFRNCTSLTTVEIPNSVISIEGAAFWGCTGLTSIEIPNSVTSIDGSAFYKCTGLTSVTIGNSVTSIGTYVFHGCTSLISITIPNSVTSIGNNAFSGCTELKSVVIGNGVTSIGENAFRGCTSLTSFVIKNPIPPSLGKNCLIYVNEYNQYITLNTDIYVPCGLIETYKSATSWAEYASKIKYQTYTITTNAQHGNVTIEPDEFTVCSDISLTATTNEEGYYFTQWSDGIIDNPRAIVLTQDTIFTAEFSNLYSINVSCDEEYGTINGKNGSFEYLSNRTFEAVPNYGYHFTQWADGNTDNPRTIVLMQDTAFSAEFAKNVYSLTYRTNVQQGVINGATQAEYLDEVSFEAIPNYGYHFDRWSDGVTDNPRTITLTKDTAFIAEFAPDQYSISVRCEEEYGTINGEIGSFDYLSEHTYEAIFNYGYHFTKWSDGNTDNPRTVTLTKDTAFVAEFAKNTYTITDGSNKIMGYIKGVGIHEYLDTIVLTAIPVSGCHFEQWKDSITDISRTVILTQDTTFAAEFGIDKFGTCGENDALTWTYDDQSKTLTITGEGALTDNYTYGVEAPTQMNTLIIGDGVTAIGDSAFYNTRTLNHLFIGANVASIGSYAFAECRNFDDITCYSTIVPAANATTFENVGNKQYIYLYVPEDRERAYKRDEFWGEFDIQIKGTEETTTDSKSVSVEPADNTALFTWPTDSAAASYSLQITKDSVVFCTLIFNSNGQLTGIAFAPSRDESAQAPAATMSVSAMSFTVTGLNSASKYAYRLSVTDESQKEIQAYSGEFATAGYEGEVNPGGDPEINPEGIDNLSALEKATKLLRDGQILILRGEKVYTLQGQEVR